MNAPYIYKALHPSLCQSHFVCPPGTNKMWQTDRPTNEALYIYRYAGSGILYTWLGMLSAAPNTSLAQKSCYLYWILRAGKDTKCQSPLISFNSKGKGGAKIINLERTCYHAALCIKPHFSFYHWCSHYFLCSYWLNTFDGEEYIVKVQITTQNWKKNRGVIDRRSQERTSFWISARGTPHHFFKLWYNMWNFMIKD